MAQGKKWLIVAIVGLVMVVVAVGIAAAGGQGSLGNASPTVGQQVYDTSVGQQVYGVPPGQAATVEQQVYGAVYGTVYGAENQDQIFLANLAAALCIDSTTLDSYLQTAETQAVAQALQKGRISQKRAEQFQSQIGQGRSLFGLIDPRQLAKALGVKPAALESALETAAGQTVDQEIQDGAITSQQAGRLRSQITMGMPVFGFRLRPQVSVAVNGYMLVSPLAKALKMKPADLITALRSGQSVAALVAGQGMTVAAVQSDLLSLLNSQRNNGAVSSQTAKAGQSQFYDQLQQSISSGAWIGQLQQLQLPGHPKAGVKKSRPL